MICLKHQKQADCYNFRYTKKTKEDEGMSGDFVNLLADLKEDEVLKLTKQRLAC